MQRISTVDLTDLSQPSGSVTPPKRFAQVNGKFYVRLTSGFFQNLRRLISWPLLALYFGVVWLQWDGMPMVLFSYAERRIIVAGNLLSWHDLPLLAGLLITGAVLLFFMAVAWGRVWCGFACPQSIWTWLFIRIEHLTEGSAARQRKADERGRSARQWLGRISKHLLWGLLALATAITFTGYFVPVRELMSDLSTLDLASGPWLWITIMAALTYANAGLVREKICLHACPYSRFQSVMFDAATRTVSYDASRGEPRAHLRGSDCNSGDCVDCRLCVQVCPTGIDIRDGLQAACIDCGACIDACDNVMQRLQRPTGLIRFASEQQLQQQPSPLWRPRLLGYAAILLIASSLLVWGFSSSTRLLVEVQRSRQALFSEMPDGRYCNDYRIKVESFVPGLQQVDIAVHSDDALHYELLGPTPLDMHSSQASWQNFRVCSEGSLQRRRPITFEFAYPQGSVRKPSTFFSGF